MLYWRKSLLSPTTIENEDGTLTITGYDGEVPTELIIPGEIDGKTVTVIGDDAFEGASAQSVIIPNTVTTLGKQAFAACGVDSIVIPDSVTTLGVGVFTNADLRGGITLGAGITELSMDMFAESALVEIVIPENVNTIREYAFAACFDLVSVVIPASVTAIHETSFISSDDVVATVEEGSYAHTWCVENDVAFELMDAVILPGENAWILPEHLTAIEEEAFLNLDMVEVVIPDGVTGIGKRAFAVCLDLVYVFIPDSVLEIASDAFEQCGKWFFYMP